MTLKELKTKLLEGYDIGQESSLALIAIIEDLRSRMGWLERRGREDNSPCYLAADSLITRGLEVLK